MKKLFIFIVFVGLCCFIFYGFSNKEKEIPVIKENTEERLVFLSYIDYSSYLKNKSSEEQKKYIDKIVNNIKESNFTGIILQVRPFADSIYNSKLFPSSKYVVSNEGEKLNFDILEYFINKSHSSNIKLFAWINPYRIRSNNDTSDMSLNTIFYNWLKTDKIEVSDNGIYFNPAKEEVINLIVDGVKEVANYDVDGILFDDYFYPNKTIDLEEFNKYQKDGGDLLIDDYRRQNVLLLVKNCYEKIKKINKNILFGISPAGNDINNYNEEYLDVKNIVNNKYVDFLMPQIYYGFENDSLPFIDTIEYWNNIIKGKDIDLYVALALYKSGLEDSYAGEGIAEWILNADVIKKQILIGRSKSNYKGFSIFRYDYFYNPSTDNRQLIDEIKNVNSIF